MYKCPYCDKESKARPGFVLHLVRCEKGPKGDIAKLDFYTKIYNYTKEDFIKDVLVDKIPFTKISKKFNYNYDLLGFYAKLCGIAVTRKEWSEFRRKRIDFNKHVTKLLSLDKKACDVKDSKDHLKDTTNEITDNLDGTPVENIGEEVVDKTSYLYSKDFVFRNIGSLTPGTFKKILKDERYKKLTKIDAETEMKIAKAFSRGLNDLQVSKFYPEVPLRIIKNIIDRCIVYQEKNNGE